MVLTDEPDDESAENNKLPPSSDLMTILKQSNDELVLACEAALLLRGVAGAIVDPLALSGEKETYRQRYKEIEEQIRQAVKGAKNLK